MPHNILKKSVLFKGLEDNLEQVLPCLNPQLRSYEKDNIIILSGEPVKFVGIVLSGNVKIIKEDIEGSINILMNLNEGDLFGEAFACAGFKKSLVTVQANEKSEIMFIDYRRIITVCSSACNFHTKLIENLLMLIAEKNILLNEKMEIISKRTIRDKLLAYLQTQKDMVNSNKFTIPFNRTELAAYLYMDRSAMTRELTHMANDGLIKFDKKNFEIL